VRRFVRTASSHGVVRSGEECDHQAHRLMHPAPTARPRLMRRLFVVLVLIAYTVCLCVLQSYVSFKFPIKTDRYKHPFSRHVADRVAAYALLFRSGSRSQNATMSVEEIHEIVAATSTRHGVEPCLVHAVVLYESGLNPNTITTTGAIGLMALQPTTARELSLDDPFDPHANVDGGTRLLKQLSQDFNGDVDLILAGYNAGVNAVKRFHGVPRFPETMDYVKHVGGIYKLCKANPQAFSTIILGSLPT